MKRYLKLSGFALIFIGSVFTGPIFSAPAIDTFVPAFVAADSNGERVDYSEFVGKPLIVHFWSTRCKTCPDLQKMVEQQIDNHGADDLVFLGMSVLAEPGIEPQAYLKEKGLSFKTLLRGELVASQFGVRNVPTTFFVNREGYIKYITQSSTPGEDAVIDAIKEISQ